MLLVCHAWSAAVCADTQLWEAIALKRFPRIRALAAALAGPVSFEALYRDQLTALKPPPTLPDAPSTSLDDYLFTFEVVRGDNVLAAYTGPLERGGDGIGMRDGGSVQLWEANRPASLPVKDFDYGLDFDDQDPSLAELGLKVCVTRKAPLSTLLLYESHGRRDVALDGIAWEFVDMPVHAVVAATVGSINAANDEQGREPAELWQSRPWLHADGCLMRIFREQGGEDMGEQQLLTYLEHVAPWHNS